jgi:hypothetical protein
MSSFNLTIQIDQYKKSYSNFKILNFEGYLQNKPDIKKSVLSVHDFPLKKNLSDVIFYVVHHFS